MDTRWPVFRVAELQAKGSLLVEDGNHGEYRPRPGEFGSGATAFVRASDVDNGRVLFDSADRISDIALARVRKGIGKGGDILFSHKGTVGKVALAPRDAPPFVCSPQTTFWRVLDPKTLDERFLYAFMRSGWFAEQWHARKGETDMADYVSLTAQREFSVPVPSIEEQQAIGRILGALDEKIYLNHELNRTLESIAYGIFRSWFVDFDPINARAAGRQPFAIDAVAAAAFGPRFVSSDLGPIPLGWSVGVLRNAFRLTMGQSPSSTTYNEDGEGVPFYQGKADFGFRFPSPRVFCTAPTRFAELDDTLVTVRAPVGDVNLAGESCAIGRGLAAVRHQSGSASFTYYAMRSLGDEFESFQAEGTLFGSIRRTEFEGIRLVAPPDSLVSLFQLRAGPMDERIRANEREIQILTRLRQTLLLELFFNSIRVGEAEALVERAGA